jgi:hypothetical protein
MNKVVIFQQSESGIFTCWVSTAPTVSRNINVFFELPVVDRLVPANFGADTGSTDHRKERVSLFGHCDFNARKPSA